MLGVTVRLPPPGASDTMRTTSMGQAPGRGAATSGVASLGEIRGKTQFTVGVDDDGIDTGQAVN